MHVRSILSIFCVAIVVTFNTSPAMAQANSKQVASLMGSANDDVDAGRYADAAKEFQQVTALDPKNAQAWYSLAQCLEKTGNRTGAKSAYQSALKAQPQGHIADLAHAALSNYPILDCSDCPEMVVIPAGSHTLFGDQLKPATVNVSKFALGKTLVTQGQWKAIMGNNPSHFTKCGSNCPVESVNWNDIQEYLRRLSQKTGQHYRLPTETEWEYACQARNNTTYCGDEALDSVAWYYENSRGTTQPVQLKEANAFGLYDMSGDVWEWMETCYNNNCAAGHVLRGGSWNDERQILRAAARSAYVGTLRDYDVGFRVARSAP